MEGFVIKPAGYIPGSAIPACFRCTAAPRWSSAASSTTRYSAWPAWATSSSTNPRGADGRRGGFRQPDRAARTIDFDDFMGSPTRLSPDVPTLIPERIGICGGSQRVHVQLDDRPPQRYAAAVSQRSISNYMTKSCARILASPTTWPSWAPHPGEDFDTCWEHSPLKMAHRATTPTLFVQSDGDYRCWMSDAVQMFSALKRSGVDTRLVLFHGGAMSSPARASRKTASPACGS